MFPKENSLLLLQHCTRHCAQQCQPTTRCNWRAALRAMLHHGQPKLSSDLKFIMKECMGASVSSK